jgi:hypothetical protein
MSNGDATGTLEAYIRRIGECKHEWYVSPSARDSRMPYPARNDAADGLDEGPRQ